MLRAIVRGLGIAGVATSWVISVYLWRLQPTRVPVHFGLNGIADATEQPTISVLLLDPVVVTIVWLLGLGSGAVSWYQAKRRPAARARQAVEAAISELLAMVGVFGLVGLQIVTLLWVVRGGSANALVAGIPAVIVLLSLTIGLAVREDWRERLGARWWSSSSDNNG